VFTDNETLWNFVNLEICPLSLNLSKMLIEEGGVCARAHTRS